MREIEKALAAVWQSAVRRQQAEPERDAPPVIARTSVLNFVVYASSRGVSERAASSIGHLAGTHPSRSIMILAEPDDPDHSLGASVRALRSRRGSGGRFFFEQVDLTARGGMIEHLPSIIRQLTVHDLPTFLWWPGEPQIDSTFFRELAAEADRVIVDSSDFADPEAGLAALARYAGSSRGGASDLNWDRLIEWRELLAQFFDAAPARPFLSGVTEARLEYAFDPGAQRSSAQALLVIGWLASRLGWQPQSAEVRENGLLLHVRSPGGSVKAQIDAVRDHGAAPGALTAITLVASADGRGARFSAVADVDAEHATTTVEIEGTAPVARTVSLEQPSESILLAAEIESFGRERAFDDALQVAGALARGR